MRPGDRGLFARRTMKALLALAALLATAATAPAATASPLVPPGYQVERVVMIYRHGLRAPLDDEIGARAFAREPWPAWGTPPGLLTPHGREAMRQIGLYDRAWLASLGLLPARGCPAAADVLIWTNTEARTIASGEELSEGLAPGCELPAQHRPAGETDPLFSAEAAELGFDAAKGLADVMATTGGPAVLMAPEGADVRAAEDILGCRHDPSPCDIAAEPASLAVSPDGRGLALKGPIQILSGTAEVFLLQYGEGMPLDRVGWGRATPDKLAQVSRLHALLFDVFDRSPRMARRTAAALAPALSSDLQDKSRRLVLLVGHDNNIAALTSLLHVHFQVQGYGHDDPPPGGALGFAVLRDVRTGVRYVRVFYQAQTLKQLRRLTPLTLADPPDQQVLTPSCASGSQALCRVADLQALLSSLNAAH